MSERYSTEPEAVRMDKKALRRRRRVGHLSDTEYKVMRDLRQQADAYRDNLAGRPGAVAAWLRIIADELETASPHGQVKG